MNGCLPGDRRRRLLVVAGLALFGALAFFGLIGMILKGTGATESLVGLFGAAIVLTVSRRKAHNPRPPTNPTKRPDRYEKAATSLLVLQVGAGACGLGLVLCLMFLCGSRADREAPVEALWLAAGVFTLLAIVLWAASWIFRMLWDTANANWQQLRLLESFVGEPAAGGPKEATGDEPPKQPISPPPAPTPATQPAKRPLHRRYRVTVDDGDEFDIRADSDAAARQLARAKVGDPARIRRIRRLPD